MPEIYIDLETVPSQQLKPDPEMVKVPGNYTKPETIKKYQQEHADEVYRKLALDPLWCQVIAISAAYEDEDSVISSGEDEEQIFREFDNWIARLAEEPKSTKDLIRNSPDTWFIVGVNLFEFDLSIIHLRAQKYGCKNIQGLLRDLSPYDKRVFDVMRMALPTKKSAYVSMDDLCRFFGIEGKGEIDGSMVYDYFLQGRIGEIAEYCQKDVERTRELYKLLT